MHAGGQQNVYRGQRITRYCGLVAGKAIVGANRFKDMSVGIGDLVGGRSATCERKLWRERDLAMEELEQRLIALATCPVVLLGRDDGMLMASASRTAAVFE
ncbi:MAG: heavy metal-binding domain-containing protein [Xanthomonadaceae bacterium]|nr:heavy metal-binding domain-containing protein [Xanthomonadaceae bacterium]